MGRRSKMADRMFTLVFFFIQFPAKVAWGGYDFNAELSKKPLSESGPKTSDYDIIAIWQKGQNIEFLDINRSILTTLVKVTPVLILD